MGVDKETARGRNLQWARVLIKTNGNKVPGSFKLVIEELCFLVNLWWEIPPWVASMVPRAESQEEGEKKGSDTRATSRMGLAGSNLAEKVSLPGKMRLVEEATLLVSFEGRLQQEV